MKKHKFLGSFAIVMVAVVGAISLAACSTRYATSTSDEYLCVFDGSQQGGQKLKYQIPPGSKSVQINDSDQVVRLPASSRFYMVTTDRSIADPGTASFYSGNAKGGVPVQVEGQVRFRFNLDKACEWYSKHGRRNAGGGDLGFNARGNPADVAQLGWFKFLNENFGTTMQEVVSEKIGNYDWAYLHYNYPVNAGEDGVVPAGQQPGQPTRLALATDLGTNFTKRLNANLGTAPGQPGYFCGVDPDASGGNTGCPDMTFQVRYAGPGNDSALVKNRQEVEATKQALETSRLQGQLQSSQQDQIIKAEATKAAVLEAQIRTAEAQARIDTAKCRQLAPFGLDCDGHRPNGSSISVGTAPAPAKG